MDVQRAASGTLFPGHIHASCCREKKYNHLSRDCLWIACLKGLGYLKWFLTCWNAVILDYYEHWINDSYCEEKGGSSHHCSVDLPKLLGLTFQSALLRHRSWRVNLPSFCVCLSPFKTRWKMQLFILSRLFFISAAPSPHTWLVFTNTWKPSNPWRKEWKWNRSHSLPSGTERQKQLVFPATIMGICFVWLPQNCAFQTHSLLVNEEQARWQNKDFFCSIVHSGCGLFVTKWLSPLNLSPFATREGS